MEITPKFEYVKGSFDTKITQMVCVPSLKHGVVELCIKSDNGWNIPIGEIKLYDSGKYVDFKATYEDVVKLGNEIARRWNECSDKQ